MKFCLLINVLCVFILASDGAVMRGNYQDPKYPGKCVVGELIVSAGETVKNPFSSCGRMLCGDNGNAVFHTCGVIAPPEGYMLGEPIKPTAPYPECCNKHFVPIDKSN